MEDDRDAPGGGASLVGAGGDGYGDRMGNTWGTIKTLKEVVQALA